MSKANICLIGLSNQFVDKNALLLSKKLDMFYANASEIIQFELFDIKKMEETCGKEYLEKKESSIIRRICSYENTIVNIEYFYLNSDVNYKFISDNCLIIYLRLNQKQYIEEIKKEDLSKSAMSLNIDLYQDRDFVCSKKADIVVECNVCSEKELMDVILQKMLVYYEK